MKRSLWALPLCLIGACAIIVGAGAQRGGKGPTGSPGGSPADPSPTAPAPAAGVNEPFKIGNLTFPSKAAWIANGGYCATEIPSDQLVLAVENDLAALKATISRTQTHSRSRFHAAAKTVNVYFHVITDTKGNGDATDAELQAQIDQMNEAYAGQQKRDPAFKISAQETADM